MKFLTMGEKVKKLREQLKLTQEDLQSEKVTRGLISMIETGRRDVTYGSGVKLAEKFNEKAEELNIIMNIDEAYLMRSPAEDAEIYCLNKLKNDDITKSTIDEIFEIINQYNLLFVQAKTYFKIGQINEEKRNFDDACINYDKALKIYKTMGKDKELGLVYLRLGISKGKNLQHDTAMVYFNSSQYYSFIYDDEDIQKLSLYNLANAYKHLNKIDLALETVERYLEVSDESDVFYIYGHGIKANCYEAKKDYDKAIETYKEILLKVSDNTNIFIGYAYNNLGGLYADLNNFEESLKYFEMAEKFRDSLDKVNLGATLIEKSNVFLKQKKYTDAINAIDLGLNYAIEFNDMEYIIKGYYISADIYDKSNDLVNLEKSYLKIIELLKIKKDNNSLKSIYNKIVLMYLNQKKTALCEKYLLLSNDLN